MATISKSRFISGIQCHKKLFFDVNRKDLKPQISDEQERLFSTGHTIGKLAQELFPNGKDASENINGDWSIAIARTKEWLLGDTQTIYEATFSHSKTFAALDILYKKDNEYWAIEVKSSSSVKEYHTKDASIQYWVMEKCGLRPDKFFILHINSSYVMDGVLNPKKLFQLTEITEQVKINQAWISEEIELQIDVLENRTEPSVKIGRHCQTPFSCDYMHHCWKHIPENSVFDLALAKGKEWELYDRGIIELKDIPDDEVINHRQQLQVQGIKHNKKHIDKSAISEFIKKLEFPLYFLDFETISSAIPFMNGAKPFQQIPFQYSLHILANADSELIHKEFLAEPIDFDACSEIDPRKSLINQLKKDIEIQGTIISYNATFEINVLKSLTSIFPEEENFIMQLCSRFADLLIPFKNGWFYLPEMQNSASIKSVLPALAPEFSYSDLTIGNGGMASSIFLALIHDQFEGDKQEIKTNLLKYCERDTYGMYVIYLELLKAV